MPNLAPLLTLGADEPVETPRGHIISGDHNPTPGHAFVPALEELELYDITLASEDDLSEDLGSENSLLDALATRTAVRPRLTMTACHVGDDAYESDMDEGTGLYPFEFYDSDASDEFYLVVDDGSAGLR